MFFRKRGEGMGDVTSKKFSRIYTQLINVANAAKAHSVSMVKDMGAESISDLSVGSFKDLVIEVERLDVLYREG